MLPVHGPVDYLVRTPDRSPRRQTPHIQGVTPESTALAARVTMTGAARTASFVGLERFELPASSSRTRRSTKLSYNPIVPPAEAVPVAPALTSRGSKRTRSGDSLDAHDAKMAWAPHVTAELYQVQRVLVEMTRFERATFRPPAGRATNCATSRCCPRPPSLISRRRPGSLYVFGWAHHSVVPAALYAQTQTAAALARLHPTSRLPGSSVP
jgi:hypothetical protein